MSLLYIISNLCIEYFGVIFLTAGLAKHTLSYHLALPYIGHRCKTRKDNKLLSSLYIYEILRSLTHMENFIFSVSMLVICS